MIVPFRTMLVSINESDVSNMAFTAAVRLIVVGSHQRRGMAEIMLGSTSNYVMHHAPCSVLVVHPDTKNEDTLASTTHVAAGKGVAVA